ncbi:MAG: methyltransferase domain-containing protein [Deltaproteobacteria bacterium]|nr:methyltransferase domain-containing protein [Deltaproteobacteria bacterium]
MINPPETAVLQQAGSARHQEEPTVWQDPTNPQKQKLSIRALEELGAPESVKLLDYGCGNGALAGVFYDRGYRVSAIDISETRIADGSARFSGVQFRVVRPHEPVSFAAGAFDAIFCSEVIEHVYDVHFIFGEFSRLLRPGGLLILTTPYHGRIKNVIVSLFFFERHFDPTWEHIRFWTRKSLTKVCTAHGLQPIKWASVGRFWPVPKSFFVVCRRKQGAGSMGQGGGKS